MKLNSLVLDNFKLFKHLEIDFSAITILTGANSSGKSSILNALASILQTQSPNLFPFDFNPNGKNCQLGNFRDIANKNNTRSSFKIALSFSENKSKQHFEAEYRYSVSGEHILPKKIMYKEDQNYFELAWRGSKAGYELLFSSQDIDDGKFQADILNLLNAIDIQTASSASTSSKTTIKKESFAEIFARDFSEQKNLNGKWQKIEEKTVNEIKSRLKEKIFTRSIYNDLIKTTNIIQSKFIYIGPVRSYPSRYYSYEDFGNQLDPTGQDCIKTLYKWKKSNSKYYKEVFDLISDLGLVSQATTKEGDDIFQMDVTPSNHNHASNFCDVGFGISQILPVLVNDVSLGREGTVLVNQPEVHLHPSSQARLGNYFASRIKNRNYVIETHSEYLINRLRLLVAQGKIKSEDISVYFFDNNEKTDGPSVHKIILSKNGSLLHAPQSFFDTYSNDTFNLAMANLNGDESSHEVAE